MQAFDASSMIYAWDNYPVRQLPGLWKWMAFQIVERNVVMPTVAFDEVSNKSPDCGGWLTDTDLQKLGVTNEVLQEALRIKGLLGIVNDNYHAKGVGENDIIIIATAKVLGAELISDERRQNILPDVPSKMKIPAVCNMRDIDVSCINFVEYIKRSGEVFG